MIGLLIVHGIGEQRRGETAAKLLVGLKAAYGDAVQVALDANGYPATVTANGRTVRLYEVHWAEILSAKKTRGSFTWQIPNTVVWHPMWCRRLGLLPSKEYSAPLVWCRMLTLVPLVPAGYLAYLGVRFFAQVFDKARREAFEQKMREQKPWDERALAYASFTADAPTRVDEILDSVVADVPNYMRSIVAGEGPAFEILECFHAQMARAQSGGCDAVHVLAHSLGTVIAFHALSGLGQTADQPKAAPLRLFTIGSPLEKIRFFWPWTLRNVQPSRHPDFQWVNFHHRADRVSGYLKRFAPFSQLRNVRLKGGGGLLRSHVVYERSPEFLSVLTEALFGAPAVPRLAWPQRMKDRGLGLAENVLGPVALTVSIIVGLAFVAGVITIPAYLIAWPFRWAGAEVIGLRIQNGVVWFTMFGMTVSMLLWVRARCKEAKLVVERACAHTTSTESVNA